MKQITWSVEMSSIKLTESVGINGKNKPNDIKAIQRALNAQIIKIPPTQQLIVDGKLGSKPEKSKTVAAIKLFQSKVVGMVRPDGVIDVRGRTHRKLNEISAKAASTMVKPLSANQRATLKRNIEKYEGRVSHMYRCTEGKVTIGIGHMIKDIGAAKKLSFVNRATGKIATSAEIENDFNEVMKRPYGLSEMAEDFKPYTKLDMKTFDIEQQVSRHISSFESELKSLYGKDKFSSFPDDVKLALFDMIFNLGMTNLKNKFPKFNKHIANSDFKKAAQESSRTKISDDRNSYVRKLLSDSK